MDMCMNVNIDRVREISCVSSLPSCLSVVRPGPGPSREPAASASSPAWKAEPQTCGLPCSAASCVGSGAAGMPAPPRRHAPSRIPKFRTSVCVLYLIFLFKFAFLNMFLKLSEQ